MSFLGAIHHFFLNQSGEGVTHLERGQVAAPDLSDFLADGCPKHLSLPLHCFSDDLFKRDVALFQLF